ncbi:MAG: hypothetical protein CMJ96_04220 [Planctomycetes bacterium]|nr:hypothetical protein [Planctomycetota bacterium]
MPLKPGNRMDASEIAEWMGISRQHFTLSCRRGQVPNAYQSRGGHWRVRYSKEFEEWFLLRVGMPTDFFIGGPTPQSYESFNDRMSEERRQVEMLEKALKKRQKLLRQAEKSERRIQQELNGGDAS